MPFATVLLISFGLHALIGWSLAADLSAFAAGAPGALWALLVLSALLLPAGFVLRRQARATWARALHALGFTFMGLFSSLFVLALLRELALLPAGLVHLVWPQTLDLAAWRSHSALVTVLLALAATAWGYLNARRTASVVRIDIPVAGLPDALHGFTMAQISDIHVGPTIRTAYLQRIVVAGQSAGGRPGGDHRRPGRRQRARAGTPCRAAARTCVRPTAPSSSPATTSITRVSKPGWRCCGGLGVQVLMNEHVVIHHHHDAQDPERAMLVVAGVTDFGAHHFDESHRSDPHQALADAPLQAVFRLLLAHQPRSAPMAAAAGFDLQLSGHTHGGQFWPWNHFVRLQQPFTAGLHRLQSLWVYTSRGTGYWGPPKRFGAPSEITHLRLVRATA
jgi:predicted MPP superfamily phosphohydrolase